MQDNIWTLFLCGLLVVALVIGVAFAQCVKIKANKGGVVKLRNGVELVIPPKSLKKDTKINAHMMARQIDPTKKKGSKRNQLVFDFSPSGTKFDAKRPAELHIDEKFLKKEKIDDIVICEDGEGEEAVFEKKGKKLIIYIPHFSHYYFARR